jgi:hypothetical protein
MSQFSSVKITKKYKFCGQDIEIQKLSVNNVFEIQKMTKEAEANPSDDSNLKIMVAVLKMGSAELVDETEESLFELPIDELNKLSSAIMEHSGMGKSN